MWRFYAICALWLAVLAANVAINLYRVWWLAFPFGCGGVMFAASASHRLILGKWLDYRPAFRLLFDREYRERITRPQ